MGENATEGIFIGTYVFVFIVALSATIILFNTINMYADNSYNYGKVIENSGTLIETIPSTTYRVVTGDQLIACYYNYLKDDTTIYDITVRDINDTIVFEDHLIHSIAYSYSFDKVVEKADPTKTYYMEYQSTKTDSIDGKRHAKILIKEIVIEEEV